MAKLTARARKAIPSKSFAEPGKRAYPIEDASHARNALARVSQFGSSAEKAKVRAAVHRKYPEIGMKGKSNSPREKRPSEALEQRGNYAAQKRDGEREALSHAEFNGLDHGVRDHMKGRDGSC